MRTGMSSRMLWGGVLAVILLVILLFAWGGFNVGTEPVGPTGADIEENAPVDGAPGTAAQGGDEITPGDTTAAPEPAGPEDGAAEDGATTE